MTVQKPRKKKNYINNADFYESIKTYQAELKKNPNAIPPDYIGLCFMAMSKKISNKLCFSGYCVDSETEALTKRGWLTYDQIRESDIVLSLDPSDGVLKWSQIHEIYRGEWNGNLFKITGATIDALVTPRHKFVSKETGLKPLEEFGIKEHFLTMGEAVEDGWRLYSDEFVELVGWFVTEGSVGRYKKVSGETSQYLRIHQSYKANEEKCARIRKCLDFLEPNSYVEHLREDRGESVFNISSKSLVSGLLLEVTQDKNLSIEFILSLTQKQRLLLIETMVSGDGWKTCGSKESTWQYFQKDKHHIDMFLMLCTLAGKTTNTSYRKWDTEFGYCKGYVVTITDKKTSYLEKVNFHGGRSGHKKYSPSVPYNGIVWCPRTDYGTIICRRGTKVYATGQTYKDEFIGDSIENCVKALNNFDPQKSNNPFGYFSSCIHNAFVRRIQKEKKQQYIKLKLTQHTFIIDNLDEEGIGRTLYDNNEAYIEEFEASQERKKLKKSPKRVGKKVGLDKLIG